MAYPEVATSGRCKLVVMAIETSGRWSDEPAEMIRLLTGADVGAPVDACSLLLVPLACPMVSNGW